MSVQDYSSDALAPQYDSTSILVNRLSTWKYTVEYLISYLQNYLSFQKQATSSIEKLRKGLSDPPQFLVSPEQANSTKKDKKDLASPAAASAAAVPGTFAAAFANLQQKTEYLGTQSESAANNIKNNLIPNLQTALKEIEQQYKTLKSSNSKLTKSIEKSRGETEKLVEKLGKFSASQGQMEPTDDPYVLKRRIKASISEQIEYENETAEQGLGVQKNFLSFEEHLVGLIQQVMGNLQHVVETFGTAQISSLADISMSFGSIDKNKEWSDFLSHNKGHLVPSTGYQRTVDNVSFHNEDAASTQPVIAGHLTRTTTVLKKLQTSFYAVTASGYLQEFKSENPTVDPTPTLSLYLPHSVLGTLPPPSSTDFSFKIDAKNSNKKFGRGHSYQFRASSYDELSEWYYAIARKCVSESSEIGEASAAGAEAGEAARFNDTEPESLESTLAPTNNPFATFPSAAQPETAAGTAAGISVPGSPVIASHKALSEPDVELPSAPATTDTIHPVTADK